MRDKKTTIYKQKKKLYIYKTDLKRWEKERHDNNIQERHGTGRVFLKKKVF